MAALSESGVEPWRKRSAWKDVYKRQDVVYPACGSSNSAIALTLDELAAYTPGSIWVDVCKLPE